MPKDTGTKRTSTGKVEIDASTATAEVVGGGIKIGDSSDTTAGVVRYHNNKLQYYNGTTWVDCGAFFVTGGLQAQASYTQFASDTTEVFAFDTEAQP